MQMTELIDAARFVVDSDGRKKAVLLDYDRWLELLEDLSDLQQIDGVRSSGEETIPWEQAKEELRSQGVDVSPQEVLNAGL